jgi:hypothetical protein
MKQLHSGEPFPTTDEDAQQYLPDHPSAVGLYRVIRVQGDTIADALVYVYEVVLKAVGTYEKRNH